MAKIERHADGSVTIAVPKTADEEFDPNDGIIYAVETLTEEEWKAVSKQASLNETAKAEKEAEKDAEQAAKKLAKDEAGEEPEEDEG